MSRFRTSPIGPSTAALALVGALVLIPAGAARADELAVTDYAGLQAALDPGAPLSEPRTVVLGADIVATVSGVLTVAAGAPITLDLAGYDLDLDGAADTLTGSIALAAGADLTIADTTATGGTLTAAGAPGVAGTPGQAGIRTTGAALTITGRAVVVARGGSVVSALSTDDGAGAGIGGDGGSGDGGTVAIDAEADVTAIGGSTIAVGNDYAGAGAGIGGGGGSDVDPVVGDGGGGDGGTVSIDGRAHVVAAGGSSSADSGNYGGGGAGIGGGGAGLASDTSSNPGAGGTVAIGGIAQVTATGGGGVGGLLNLGGGGAGIGGGGPGLYDPTPPADGGTASVFVLATLAATDGVGDPTRPAVPATLATTYPTLTGVAPATGIPGDALTIAGSGLAFASAVTIGGVPAAFAVAGDGALVVTVPAGSGSGLPVAVTVSHPEGSPTATAELADAFSYARALPATGDAPGPAWPLGALLLAAGALLVLGRRRGTAR